MSDHFSVNENINNIFEKLESFLKTKTVVGEPMQIGEITLVPFIDISFGLGTGGGTGTESKGNSGSGGGAGSGGKISATAVLVIKDGQVELIPIKKGGGLEKLIDMVPDIIEKANQHHQSKEQNTV